MFYLFIINGIQCELVRESVLFWYKIILIKCQVVFISQGCNFVNSVLINRYEKLIKFVCNSFVVFIVCLLRCRFVGDVLVNCFLDIIGVIWIFLDLLGYKFLFSNFDFFFYFLFEIFVGSLRQWIICFFCFFLLIIFGFY